MFAIRFPLRVGLDVAGGLAGLGQDDVAAGVAGQRHETAAAGGVEPTLALRPGDVAAQPQAVDLLRLGRLRIGERPHLAVVAVLGARPRPAVRARYVEMAHIVEGTGPDVGGALWRTHTVWRRTCRSPPSNEVVRPRTIHRWRCANRSPEKEPL